MMVTVPSGSIETNASGSLTSPRGIASPPVGHGSNAAAGLAKAASARPTPVRNSRRSTVRSRMGAAVGAAVRAIGAPVSTPAFLRWLNMAQLPVAARRTAATMRW